MIVKEIQAKTLLSGSPRTDPWFGIKYTLNTRRGCMHHCVYCDSRSECYQIEDFDGEVLVKANALDSLRRELLRKRVKEYAGHPTKGSAMICWNDSVFCRREVGRVRWARRWVLTGCARFWWLR